MADVLLIRPDGRTYRPRREGLRAHAWENDDDNGCIVFGTLDPEAARDLARRACADWFGDADSFEPTNPTPGWWRDGFGAYGRTWIEDDQKGAPGVMFTWAESDTGSSSKEAR